MIAPNDDRESIVHKLYSSRNPVMPELKILLRFGSFSSSFGDLNFPLTTIQFRTYWATLQRIAQNCFIMLGCMKDFFWVFFKLGIFLFCQNNFSNLIFSSKISYVFQHILSYLVSYLKVKRVLCFCFQRNVLIPHSCKQFDLWRGSFESLKFFCFLVSLVTFSLNYLAALSGTIETGTQI